MLPGESGWEIWTQQEGGAYARVEATDQLHCGEVENFPAGELTFLFSSRSITAVPMKVASDDDELFEDLAGMHAERMGIRSDPMAGQLSDVFVVDRGSQSTTLLAVFLKAPQMGDLPSKGPNAFDFSARAFPVDGTAIAIWKELGRWVFGVYFDSKLLYCQATAFDSAEPDVALAREIKIALMQMSMQEISIEPRRIIVWSDVDCDTSALKQVFTLPLEVMPKPAPVLPEPLSKLLPEDVRAARDEATKKRNIMMAVAAIVVLYLGGVAWLGYGLWQKSSQIAELEQRADEIAPERQAYEAHMMKWNELQEAIDENYWPVDIMDRISECIPPNSALRLNSAEISGYSIKLNGEARDLGSVKSFSKNLEKHNGLSRLDWKFAEPTQNTRGWAFRYGADVPKVAAQP